MEIIGTVTQNANVKTLKDERKVVSFSIVMNDYYRTKGGERKNMATFIDCSYWMGDKIAAYITKGTVVSLYGRIGINAYTNMEGVAKASLTFHVNDIKLVSKASGFGKEKGLATKESKDDLPF